MNDTQEPKIRIAVRSLYDLQKLRIQLGNRIVASFRDKLGIDPSQAESEVPDAEAILEGLRAEYKRITEGVTRITKKTKWQSNLMTSASEMRLLESYEHLLSSESSHIKMIDWELEQIPVYTHWLKNVRGVGPTMAGVILSEIDITKCNSISALWAYCGLDVVITVNEDTGEITQEGRSRKKHHLKPKTYTNRDGNTIETVGITFNPMLKTKLIGVLGSVFLKLGGHYRTIYDGYKHRLECHPSHQTKTKGHRHNMAIRYMVKQFLADLWTEWRTLEGLPVRTPYAECKLGIVHSKAA